MRFSTSRFHFPGGASFDSGRLSLRGRKDGDPRGRDPVSYHISKQPLWKDSDQLCLGQAACSWTRDLCPEDVYFCNWFGLVTCPVVQPGVGERAWWCSGTENGRLTRTMLRERRVALKGESG